MSGRYRFVGALLGGVLAAVASRAVAADDPLVALRVALEQSSDEAVLRERLATIAGPVGFELVEAPGPSFVLKLAAPLPAQRLCEAMGWKLAYAVADYAGEAASWSLRVATAGAGEGPPIDTRTPHVGSWVVDASLLGRGAGEPSKLVARAYKLGPDTATEVGALRIARWIPDWKLYDGTGPQTGSEPPRSMKATTTFKDWLEQNKGFGYPQYADLALPDARVFAAWNISYSGLNYTDYWVYCRDETSDWTLLRTGWFPPPEDQAHSAVVDAKTNELLFLGANGQVYYRVPLAECRSKRP